MIAKFVWKLEFRVTAKGKTGHASIMFEDTAAEKLHKVINRFLSIRESEKARLKANRVQDLGDVTSVNMTMLGVGFRQISLCVQFYCFKIQF